MALAFFIKYHAESNLLSVFLAYLPPWVLTLPLMGAAMVGALFACWRSTALALLAGVFSMLWLGGYGSPWRDRPLDTLEGGGLTFLTYNRGQGSNKLLVQAAENNAPDIVALQDAGRRLGQLAVLPPFLRHAFNHQLGEFALLSRWPVLESEPLNLAWPGAVAGQRLCGVRSVINWNSRRVVVYNVHLPTPRDLLYWYGRRGTFLYGLLGVIPGTLFHDRHQQNLAAWKARVDLASQLVARAHAEKDPVVLLGDLNLPPVGQAYHLLSEALQDAHSIAGEGFGNTFPANMSSIGRLVSPWTRIDHVFVSSHWEVKSSQVAAVGNSQHLPVAATIRLR